MCNEAARLRSLGEISAEFNQLKIPLRFPEGLPNLGAAPSIRITDPAAIVRVARDGLGRAAGDGGGDGAAHPDIPTPGPSRKREGGVAELVVRRWSWPGPAGKPVYNFRSEGRTFPAVVRDAAVAVTGGRCLIPLDAFFEFTDADAGALSLPLHEQGTLPSPRRGEEAAVPPGTIAGARGGKPRARKAKWRFAAADGGLLGVAGLWRAGVVPAGGGEPRAAEAFTMLTGAPGPDVAPYHSRQIVLIPRDRWADWLAGPAPAAELITPTPAGTLVATRVR